MKTCSLYGFISALAGAFLVLALYFLGFYSDPAKLSSAGWISGPLGLGIAVICTTIGVRARRAETPDSEDFGYGRAWWAGMVVSIVSSFLTAIFTYSFYAFINPGLNEMLLQASEAKLESKGLSSEKIEQFQSINRAMMNPPAEAAIGLIGGIIVGCIIALIVAACLKRPEPATPPVL